MPNYVKGLPDIEPFFYLCQSFHLYRQHNTINLTFFKKKQRYDYDKA